ncbi:MAG: hypothetical protein RL755_54 [Pseudomonadota bacterium]|jgi:hypothetical protein
MATLVKKPFQYPCEGARYFTKKHGYQIGVLNPFFDLLVGNNDEVRTDAETINFSGRWDYNGVFFGNNGIKNHDFDLVMFVWSDDDNN